MSDDRDPPLFDALRALSDMTYRHRLAEAPVADYTPQQRWYEEPHPHAEAYGLPAGHVYGSDDQPGGPPAPPLGEPAPAVDPDYYAGVAAAAPLQVGRPTGPVCCPACGSGVHPDRLR